MGKTGKNRFITVYSILDGKNRFWAGKNPTLEPRIAARTTDQSAVIEGTSGVRGAQYCPIISHELANLVVFLMVFEDFFSLPEPMLIC